MSSHREAPEISKDPVADNTDIYAFVSPEKDGTVTIVANYLPLEGPAGGPNFFEFGDDVLYSIYIDNDGDGNPDVTYDFEFEVQVGNPDTFLYNTGPITSIDAAAWNRKQFYSVTRSGGKGKGGVIGDNLTCPPCNIGPRSTPNYAGLAAAAVHSLDGGGMVFAGQRNDPFFVDLGAVFDLAAIRPLQNLHLIPLPATNSVDTLQTYNVHTIALKVPIGSLTRDGSVPTDAMSAKAVLGIWAGASRRKVRVIDGGSQQSGPWTQVSRLGNPLFNEVIVPMGRKDEWNASDPAGDSEFLQYVQHPEVAKLLPVLYPGVFPNLAGLTATRDDLVAILLTGIPTGLIPGFQNFTGTTQADYLRLNVAIPPSAAPHRFGLLGGDLAGFPNGRRLADDVVSIELKAIAGATYPLVNSHYTVDAAVVPALEQYLTPAPGRYLPSFPYVGLPYDGFSHPSP
jgi:hypothetical protein